MPDYQGIGIGVKFINAVADIITSEGYKLNLTTTTPALVNALKRSNEWALIRKGVVKLNGIENRLGTAKAFAKASSQNRPTFSFNYRGVKNA